MRFTILALLLLCAARGGTSPAPETPPTTSHASNATPEPTAPAAAASTAKEDCEPTALRITAFARSPVVKH